MNNAATTGCREFRSRKPNGAPAKFEARFGDGATELDALEALHPGELGRILVQEIERYYDATLEPPPPARHRRGRRPTSRASTGRRSERHAGELAALEDQRRRIVEEIGDMRDRISEMEEDLEAAGGADLQRDQAGT